MSLLVLNGYGCPVLIKLDSGILARSYCAEIEDDMPPPYPSAQRCG